MNHDEPVTLTERQKLAALAMRFYQGMQWEPKVGDYYTLTRESLELFIINRSDGENFYIKKVFHAGQPDNQYEEQRDPWPIATFKEGFGVNRVWVHPVILERVVEVAYLNEQKGGSK